LVTSKVVLCTVKGWKLENWFPCPEPGSAFPIRTDELPLLCTNCAMQRTHLFKLGARATSPGQDLLWNSRTQSEAQTHAVKPLPLLSSRSIFQRLHRSWSTGASTKCLVALRQVLTGKEECASQPKLPSELGVGSWELGVEGVEEWGKKEILGLRTQLPDCFVNGLCGKVGLKTEDWLLIRLGAWCSVLGSYHNRAPGP